MGPAVSQPVVGRLAPSPTGAQHVGNARTYLIAWLSARSHAGKVVLRIEDIDSPRVKAGAAEEALNDLRWLGLDWDGEPIVQTQRLDLYEQALAVLKRQELVYPCTCTRGDIASAASAPHAEHGGPAYPGTCSHRTVADADCLGNRLFAWRFRMTKALGFVDLFRGWTEDTSPMADFVVWKSAGTPAYHLAVVVDDAANSVTEVIRGDDLLPSTPRQAQLYSALGLQAPAFCHVPLVVGPDLRRLAKRHGDTRLAALRAAGVTAEALLGLLAWSCGWQQDITPVTARELLPRFRRQAIPQVPFILKADHLRQIGFEK
jgi:glutamyl-tRNA synthetase